MVDIWVEILSTSIPIANDQLRFKVKTWWEQVDVGESRKVHLHLPCQRLQDLHGRETTIFLEMWYVNEQLFPAGAMRFLGLVKQRVDNQLRNPAWNPTLEWLEVYDPIEDITRGRLLLRVDARMDVPVLPTVEDVRNLASACYDDAVAVPSCSSPRINNKVVSSRLEGNKGEARGRGRSSRNHEIEAGDEDLKCVQNILCGGTCMEFEGEGGFAFGTPVDHRCEKRSTTPSQTLSETQEQEDSEVDRVIQLLNNGMLIEPSEIGSNNNSTSTSIAGSRGKAITQTKVSPVAVHDNIIRQKKIQHSTALQELDAQIEELAGIEKDLALLRPKKAGVVSTHFPTRSQNPNSANRPRTSRSGPDEPDKSSKGPTFKEPTPDFTLYGSQLKSSRSSAIPEKLSEAQRPPSPTRSIASSNFSECSSINFPPVSARCGAVFFDAECTFP